MTWNKIRIENPQILGDTVKILWPQWSAARNLSTTTGILPSLSAIYVEICGNKMPTKGNRWFLLQILLLAQHVSGTTMPIIRSSRVLYRWLLPVVFGILVLKLSVWCGAEGYVSGQPANRTHNHQLHTIPITWKPTHQISQAAATCIILSSSWWWAQWRPKHVEQAIRSAIKIICCI